MSSIFVSYSRKDEVFARRLAASLSDMGMDVWIDVDDIPVGKKWSSAIQHGLDRADLMILVISPDSMASQNVEDEWQYFLDTGKQVVPVLARPAKIHFQLNRIQYVDFHNQEYAPAFEQLVRKMGEQGITFQSSPAGVSLTPGAPRLPAIGRKRLMGGAGVIVTLIALGLVFNWQNTQSSNEKLTQTAITNKDLTIDSLVRFTATAAPLIDSILTETAEANVPRVTAKDDTDVLSGDGSDFPKVARLAKGERALALGVGEGGYYIELADGRHGWVNKNSVDLNVPLSSLNFIDDDELPTFTPTPDS